MTKRMVFGIVFGACAGIIDVIPMVVQRLPWEADISAFSLWLISGFLIASSSLNVNAIAKGIIVSYLVLLPCAVIIGWHNPVYLIPIAIMTLILGGLLGFVVGRIN